MHLNVITNVPLKEKAMESVSGNLWFYLTSPSSEGSSSKGQHSSGVGAVLQNTVSSISQNLSYVHDDT